MADRPGLQPAAQAGCGRAHALIAGKVPRLNIEITRLVDDRHVVTQKVVVALTHTGRTVEQQIVVDVVLAAERGKGIFGARLAPGLRVVVVDPVGIRNRRGCANQHALLRCVGVTLGVADVGAQAQTIAAVVQPEHRHLAVYVLVIPLGIARLAHRVKAQAKAVVLAKAAPHIQRAANLTVGSVATGEFGNRRIGRPLGHQVDAAAHRTTRRDAVD